MVPMNRIFLMDVPRRHQRSKPSTAVASAGHRQQDHVSYSITGEKLHEEEGCLRGSDKKLFHGISAKIVI